MRLLYYIAAVLAVISITLSVRNILLIKRERVG
jgi:hypothetical protein